MRGEHTSEDDGSVAMHCRVVGRSILSAYIYFAAAFFLSQITASESSPHPASITKR